MFISRRKRKEKRIYKFTVTTKKLQEVNRIKYLSIIFYSKMKFRDHMNYIEEKCTKLIFTQTKSASGFKHKTLNTVQTGGILPLIVYGAPV